MTSSGIPLLRGSATSFGDLDCQGFIRAKSSLQAAPGFDKS